MQNLLQIGLVVWDEKSKIWQCDNNEHTGGKTPYGLGPGEQQRHETKK